MTKSVKLLLWLITKFDPSKFNYNIDNIYAMDIGQMHYLDDVLCNNYNDVRKMFSSPMERPITSTNLK